MRFMMNDKQLILRAENTLDFENTFESFIFYLQQVREGYYYRDQDLSIQDVQYYIQDKKIEEADFADRMIHYEELIESASLLIKEIGALQFLQKNIFWSQKNVQFGEEIAFMLAMYSPKYIQDYIYLLKSSEVNSSDIQRQHIEAIIKKYGVSEASDAILELIAISSTMRHNISVSLLSNYKKLIFASITEHFRESDFFQVLYKKTIPVSRDICLDIHELNTSILQVLLSALFDHQKVNELIDYARKKIMHEFPMPSQTLQAY